MRYFYHEPGGTRVGPYTRDELRQLHLSGVVKPDTLVTPEGAEASIVFSELWAQWQDPQATSYLALSLAAMATTGIPPGFDIITGALYEKDTAAIYDKVLGGQ